MSYTSKIPLSGIDGSANYSNAKGNHECVVLVQKVSDAPNTSSWKKGKKVMDCTRGEISTGMIIATFDYSGKYPATNRHAAIYESHDNTGINVIDQWNKQGKAKRRKIALKKSAIRDVNDANWYYIVD